MDFLSRTPLLRFTELKAQYTVLFKYFFLNFFLAFLSYNNICGFEYHLDMYLVVIVGETEWLQFSIVRIRPSLFIALVQTCQR